MNGLSSTFFSVYSMYSTKNAAQAAVPAPKVTPPTAVEKVFLPNTDVNVVADFLRFIVVFVCTAGGGLGFGIWHAQNKRDERIQQDQERLHQHNVTEFKGGRSLNPATIKYLSQITDDELSVISKAIEKITPEQLDEWMNWIIETVKNRESCSFTSQFYVTEASYRSHQKNGNLYSGLVPTQFQVGETSYDLCVNDGNLYLRNLSDASVPPELLLTFYHLYTSSNNLIQQKFLDSDSEKSILRLQDPQIAAYIKDGTLTNHQVLTCAEHVFNTLRHPNVKTELIDRGFLSVNQIITASEAANLVLCESAIVREEVVKKQIPIGNVLNIKLHTAQILSHPLVQKELKGDSELILFMFAHSIQEWAGNLVLLNVFDQLQKKGIEKVTDVIQLTASQMENLGEKDALTLARKLAVEQAREHANVLLGGIDKITEEDSDCLTTVLEIYTDFIILFKEKFVRPDAQQDTELLLNECKGYLEKNQERLATLQSHFPSDTRLEKVEKLADLLESNAYGLQSDGDSRDRQLEKSSCSFAMFFLTEAMNQLEKNQQNRSH